MSILEQALAERDAAVEALVKLREQHWRGIYKVIEECGELIQVCGKLGPFPVGAHPGGEDLEAKLYEEIADLSAALRYFVEVNKLDGKLIEERARMKLALFRQWVLSGVTIT